MNKGLTNEELVREYRESGNTEILGELFKKNEGIIAQLSRSFSETIPNSELEDLMSEAYFPMLQAVKTYTEDKGMFSTYLKTNVTQHFITLYHKATSQKRFNAEGVLSLDAEVRNDEDSDTTLANFFEVECTDYKQVELRELINSIEYTQKEKVIVDLLGAGMAKGGIATKLGMTPIGVSKYLLGLRKKFSEAGYVVYA